MVLFAFQYPIRYQHIVMGLDGPVVKAAQSTGNKC